ncbi:zinc ABC transporter ATP-binding protein AztA [Rubrimonas cliftonensis]|uniref:Zinc/manganese transport system ATP-binding protein n=1 Tax=Rubrimonas cliftonensis TaxID=89524 RepID=A0A1H4EYP2_9RHOB|nr:zinc ABC transporter ATP-binding protein AztA [Rubrimonas cliftonensis]SEA90165.1 zinc/manganese transport system ATP-binding protein [Rubrimonas cliftonensis]
MTRAALQFQDLTLGYDRHPAVHHLCASIAAGSMTAIVGPNGAGKSTLLKAVAGALAPLAGAVLFEAARPRVAWLPQAADVDRSFPLSVGAFAAMGLWSRIGMFGGLGRGDRARLTAALEAVGMAGFADRPIGALSGGQMQRTLFARLLLQDAELILLDEPFVAIDARTTADLMALVARWRGEGRTVIAVLHDLEMVRAHFPQTLLLARELIAHGPTAEALSAANLLRARAMVEAPDPFAPVCERGPA